MILYMSYLTISLSPLAVANKGLTLLGILTTPCCTYAVCKLLDVFLITLTAFKLHRSEIPDFVRCNAIRSSVLLVCFIRVTYFPKSMA
jgi:hypothetical protein